MLQADGRWSLVSNCPTRDGGFVVTRVDITERKRAELAEREADALLRRVLEACPVNIQMTRVDDGKLLYRSPAAAALHGEVGSAKDYYFNPEDRRLYVERLRRDGFVDDYVTQIRCKDGRVIWGSISSRLIDFRGEDVIVSHTFDLTERIKMQEELERQRETLHQNEKLSALGELLAGVAHELNNPLSVVLGQSLLLKESTADQGAVERADKIINAADRCARIVKTFLAMARQGPARRTNTAIAQIIESALEVAGYAIHTSDIALDVDVAPDLPAIWADADQLGQVFINLLVNAEQALRHQEGERRITLGARYDAAREVVEVRLADTGPGIPPEILPRIFEPFFTTKEFGAGTGIGLSFCHRIIRTHGGYIRAESTRGQGTVFTITLPVSKRGASAMAAPADAPHNGHGFSCLLVEDEEDVAQLIAEMLRRDGIKVTTARSGEEALFHLDKTHYDFVLSDLRMPKMDGQRLFAIIADQYGYLADRLGFITGDTMSPEAKRFLGGAKRPYLEKPIRADELRTLVTQILGNAAVAEKHVN
jgi:PAS domain S-box-containing protein